MATEIYGPLARYAERLHSVVGDRHHVASPLGAWLLLALCGPASTGAARDELTEILGTDATSAAAAAVALLDNPHPLVPSATAVWHRPADDLAGLDGWLATLPRATAVGPMPGQADLDAWAREHTLGLIEEFPVLVEPETVLMLASALATRVSWQEPFEVAPASALGPDSAWATRLTRVLRTPEHGHTSFIATTQRAGDVIVHVTAAASVDSNPVGAVLKVVSVAATPDVNAADVLAAAYELSHSIIHNRPVQQKSLFDLKLRDTSLWTIRQEDVFSYAFSFREERHTAVLPCWFADNTYDLREPDPGFSTVTRILASLLGRENANLDVNQAVMARYGRYGFEAVAVADYGTFGMPQEGVARIAELRFGHPYAVVAVASDVRLDHGRGAVPGPWHGVPVFSAWVSEPEDLPEADAGERRSRRRMGV